MHPLAISPIDLLAKDHLLHTIYRFKPSRATFFGGLSFASSGRRCRLDDLDVFDLCASLSSTDGVAGCDFSRWSHTSSSTFWTNLNFFVALGCLVDQL